jgi:spore coat protein U-like protein
MMSRMVLVLLLGLLAWAAPGIGHAQTVSCSIGTTAVDFGVYDSANPTPNDKNGEVEITCIWTSSRSVTIQLDRGTNGLSMLNRRMRLGATTNYMFYSLHTTATRNVHWGDGTGGTASITRTTGADSGGCTGDRILIWSTIACPIYGRIPINQDVAIGAYADQVTVTVIF